MSFGYHVTTVDVLGSISKEGVKAASTEGAWPWTFFSLEPHLYPPMAFCQGVLFRFPLPEKYWVFDMNDEEMCTYDTIKPDSLEVLTEQDIWQPLSTFLALENKPKQFSYPVDFPNENLSYIFP